MIVRFLVVFLVFCFLSIDTPLAANQVPSLFFHTEEIDRINQKVRLLPPVSAIRPKHLVPLESILYLGPDDWVVWMQGRKWTPKTQNTALQIIQVMPTSLRLSARLQNGAVVTRTLSPHQSLNLLTGDVVEGG